jgi:hypothetical protein
VSRPEDASYTGNKIVPDGLPRGVQGFLLHVEISQIMVHEAGEPNSVVDFLDAEPAETTAIFMDVSSIAEVNSTEIYSVRRRKFSSAVP